MLLLRNKTASGFFCEILVMRMHSKASKNHSRFEVKRIKSGSLWRGVLNIFSLLNMPGKYTSDEEKTLMKKKSSIGSGVYFLRSSLDEIFT